MEDQGHEGQEVEKPGRKSCTERGCRSSPPASPSVGGALKEEATPALAINGVRGSGAKSGGATEVKLHDQYEAAKWLLIELQDVCVQLNALHNVIVAATLTFIRVRATRWACRWTPSPFKWPLAAIKAASRPETFCSGEKAAHFLRVATERV